MCSGVVERVDLFDDRERASGRLRGGQDGELHAEIMETFAAAGFDFAVPRPACWPHATGLSQRP
jgi:hypothetical protein